MKILAISDISHKAYYDFYEPGRFDDYDLILSCGDLDRRYLEFIATMARVPLLYVRGNHDEKLLLNPPEGCICIEDMLYEYKGIRILGLGGSHRYKQGSNMFTEKEMSKRVRKLERKIKKSKGFDILLTHAPAKGINDMDDLCHKGFAIFAELMDRYSPAYMVHGHVHLSYGHDMTRIIRYNDTTVVNAYENIDICLTI